MKNLVLIGLPGCGKTTVGHLLARRLHRPFVDCDAQIEAETSRKIEELFALEGENRFRERETECLQKVLKREGQIIAAGGGVILRQENREMLCTARVIFIDRKAENIMLTCNMIGRPLMKTTSLEQLAEERRAYYLASADSVITEETVDAIVDAIVEREV